MSIISTPEIANVSAFIDIIEKQLLPSINKGEVVLVADEATAEVIRSRFSLPCVSSDTHFHGIEVFRAIRSHLQELIGVSSLQTTDMATVSTMAQTLVLMRMAENGTDVIAQLDLDARTTFKTLQEWYSWHLPELAQIVQDPILYSRIVRIFGLRRNFDLDKMTSILGNAEMASSLLNAAAQSELPDLSPEDTRDVQQLASEILTMVEQKQHIVQWLQQKQPQQ